MRTLLVTGAAGFIGRHVVQALHRLPQMRLVPLVRGGDLRTVLRQNPAITGVIHLAGVNRPKQEEEFDSVNRGETEKLCAALTEIAFRGPVVYASSVHALAETPYGRSKHLAEDCLAEWSRQTGGSAVIYRLKNVFGKWCRPNYNSAVATFCHNISRDLPIIVIDPAREVELVYIDDVVGALVAEATRSCVPESAVRYMEILPAYRKRLGEITDLLGSFRRMRETLVIPPFDDEFVRKLYATYLGYLPPDGLGYSLPQRSDARGALAEFIKGASFGQIFVSRTKPGITRGNHYHHTKTEKFLVLEGEGVIRFRALDDGTVLDYRVRGEEMRVVDIPPGYTHSIENVGPGELITLFWASEIFDPTRPDTISENVIRCPS